MLNDLELLKESFFKSTTLKLSGPVPIDGSRVVDTTPIMPSGHWKKVDGGISKVFKFPSYKEFRIFISQVLEYEESIQHSAHITMKDLTVKFFLITSDVNVVTGIDKEYARFIDSAYKDIIQSPENAKRVFK